MSKSKKLIIIEHPYSDYDFYNCVFVPSRVPKLLEAEGACFAIENLININPKLKNKKLDIVEFMSGKGEFEKHIRDEARFEIGNYVGIDAVEQDKPRTELIVGDVLTIFPKFKADVVLALYYSASSVSGPEGQPSPRAMRSMSMNAFKNLNDGGGFFLGFAAQGEALSFDLSDGENDEENEVPIPIYNRLREKFGLGQTEKASLSFEQENVYDRKNGLMIETMKNIKVKDGDDKTVGRIEMNQPLKQLYMSESHIVDNLRQVGFKELIFFDISFDEGHVNIEKLDSIMTESEQFATHILAIK
ncbi:MAG: hypothetical protein CFH01_00976 [Alphaproteobacteria bacterium MarineAlpha2_Bin1]|nr:MAG: hypothetical protein CFH01_00976 [Alphaproteobacteria bacterium MarineAlpha2_Bin1]